MAKARKILARRKAVKSIHTVTRTMEMVATAQFKRTFNRCLSARGYIDGVSELTEEVIAKTLPQDLCHPLLLEKKPTAPRVLMILTSDRGLCGGYNSAVLARARLRRDELVNLGKAVPLHVIGKVGMTELKYAGERIEKHHKEIDPTGEGGWYRVTRLADAFIHEFLGGQISGLDVAYSTLIGSARHEPTIQTLLPMRMKTKAELEQEVKAAQRAKKTDDRWREWDSPDLLDIFAPLPQKQHEYEFVPSPAVLFQRLLPMTLRLRLFQCFLEASVTEQIARMTAMRAASDSAEDMIRTLTVQYNRTRQGQITTELAEILGGRIALQ